MSSVAFSVPANSNIGDPAGLEILKREAVTAMMNNCIAAGLIHTTADLQTWAQEINTAYKKLVQ
jgi:hypothetical protein